MITDSCNCGRSGHGCKLSGRTFQPTGHPMCARNKVRRRCQSEGLYQEGDPLKELNWCCDRGCDSINCSLKYSQIKKTDHIINEKKKNYSRGEDKKGLGSYYSPGEKHRSRHLKEKLNTEIGNQFQKYGCEINSEFEISKFPKLQKQVDVNSEKTKPYISPQKNLKISKYHPMGDFHDSLPNGKSEKEKISNDMKEKYIKEMEILRNKLGLLKDGMAGDGKRSRQKSESEIGVPELPGGVPKRARDNSPKVKLGNKKLPIHSHLNKFEYDKPAKQNLSVRNANKSSTPPPKQNTEKEDFKKSTYCKYLSLGKNEMKEKNLNKFDEDIIEGSSSEENGNDAFNVSSDDESVESNSTSTSSGSNTPSKVGEYLGFISLKEVSPNKSNDIKCKNEKLQPVPENEKLSLTQSLSDKDLFRVSLFPNVPPYVKFFMHDFKGPTLPNEIMRLLKWKLSTITPIVIRRTLLNSGFKLVRSESIQGNFEQYYNLTYVPPHRNETHEPPFPRNSRFVKKSPKESNDWTGQWGKHMKSFVFKTLRDFQKLNHFPGTFQIGRKDRLWKNLYRLMVKFGKKEFGFIPKTYILPHDRKLLRTAWEKASGPGKGQWIVKPPAAARGTGIKVVHKWGQIPKKKSLIVQKYIAQPYLINGSKFDLRLYVLMTSIHPLRIYLYDDGLVRFASVKYSDDVECLSNRFMHLTNYSINKLSNQYQVNADASSCNGHKWSLKSLWTYFSKEGVNVKALKKNLTDLVIKTIISGESNINILSKNNLPSRYCSYELFGIDVLLDHSLKPWLLEVNISPSLHSASPLDLAVKGPLVRELLNVAGFQIPAKLTKEQEEGFLESYGLKDRTHTMCYDKRLYWTALSREEKAKQEFFQNLSRKEYLNSILDNLTPDDIRHLIQFEDELTQLSRFEKIFPTTNTHAYHQFFESPRYYNMMLDAWETKYQRNRAEGIRLLSSLCHQKLHLNVPFPGGRTKSSVSQNDLNAADLENEWKAENNHESEVEAETIEILPTLPLLAVSSPKQTSAMKNLILKQKAAIKAAVVSKPTIFSTHLANRKPKTSTTPLKTFLDQDNKLEETQQPPLKENCFKVIGDIRSNGVKLLNEGKQEKLKQFSNCKLENSILNETLSSGKNVLSPSKHIHNAYIKMNSSS